MKFEPKHTPVKGGMTMKGPCSYCDDLAAPLNYRPNYPNAPTIEELLQGVKSKGTITYLKCGHFWEYQVGGIA